MSDPDPYLERIGFAPGEFGEPDLETLRRLQAAHVTAVPFETLAITGDPHGGRSGEGVTLALPALYDKIVRRERGGFCFELNGLFGWLLAELGFDADRVAARVVGDGNSAIPANHHALVVHLPEPRLVDVGLGSVKPRRPLPLDGSVRRDRAGVAWRVAESDRPDATYAVRAREPGEREWSIRYVFDPEPRPLSYFEATCDYLAASPDSPFTGDPIVALSTDRGYRTLDADTLTRVEGAREHEETVAPAEWHDVLAAEFGLSYPPDPGDGPD